MFFNSLSGNGNICFEKYPVFGIKLPIVLCKHRFIPLSTVRVNVAARHAYSVPGYAVQQGRTSVLL